MDFGTFFTNTQIERCPVTHCQLKSQNCDYGGFSQQVGGSVILQMEGNEVRAEVNVGDGYNVPVCYECSNGV